MRIILTLMLMLSGTANGKCQDRTIPGLVMIQLSRTYILSGNLTADQIQCHRTMKAPLLLALQLLKSHPSGSLHLIRTIDGCYCYRMIRDTGRLSDHAHGTAIDINAVGNEYGKVGTMDPRITAAFKAAGFLWGGDWKIPDYMHYYLPKETQHEKPDTIYPEWQRRYPIQGTTRGWRTPVRTWSLPSD